MNKLVAIVGMCGSGKSIATLFFESKGYSKIYFGGITYEKMKEENIPYTPENDNKMRVKIRNEYGMGAYAILSLPKIKEQIKKSNVVIDGLYSWDEYKILKDEFPHIKLVAIIVDKEIRYERLKNRINRNYSIDESIKRDLNEIEKTAKCGPIAYADYFILNNYSLEEYQKKLENIIEVI